MNDTLLNPQDEPQFWQEKIELRQNAARLNGAEIVKLLGSSLAESRSDFDEMYAAETISDYSYEDETRKIDSALAELADLQISSKDTEVDFRSELATRAATLKQEQESLPFGTASNQELANRRAAVAYLSAQYEDQIRIPQQVIENGVMPSEFRTAIRDWMNQTIETHNSRLQGKESKAIADSPEMHEAQERINSRYAEQLSQNQQAETVDDARKKVAEALGATAEVEKHKLLGEVLRAAKGATRIYTDIPRAVFLKSKEGDHQPIDGFNSFGDGLSQNSPQFRNEMLTDQAHSEAFLVEADTTTRYKTVLETVVTGTRFKKKTEQVERNIPDGEAPVMVINPNTGLQEIGVKVSYQFNGSRVNGEIYVGPAYKTESGRGSNMLFVESTLPKSIADKFQMEVLHSPVLAREFAKMLSINNGITNEVWDRVLQPPYDELPDGWELAVTNLQKDTQFGDMRHKVTSRQVVKVIR